MAVSIGGILYSVGMNTNGFEAGAKKVETIENNLRRQQKVNQFAQAQEAKQVNKLLQELELARMEYKQANAKLSKNATKEEINAVEKLRKQYYKLGDQYDKAVESLKAKIQQNNFNIQQMKEETKIAKANFVEEMKMQEQRLKAINTQRNMSKGVNTIFRAAGIGTAALLLRKFVGGLIDAGEEASKLQDEFYEKGVFNPEAWTYTNQQLAKFGDLTRGASGFFSDLANTSLTLPTTLAEALFTWKSFSTIAKENAEIAKRNEEHIRKIAEHKKNMLAMDERIKQLEEEIALSEQKQKDIEDVNAKARREGYEENARLISQITELQERSNWQNLSQQEQLNKLFERQKTLKWDVQRFEKGSVEQNRKVLELVQTEFEIQQIQKEQAKEIAKTQEAKRKEAEAEAKKLAEKQKQQMLARQEFELQFKIAQLEKGNAKQQAQAEAIKNAIKRNELMEKYGYDIEQATRALKAQKELENKGNAQYSQEDIEKAKRVLERGKGGTIGKKTLEQAQAIVDGKALGNDRVSMFKDVQAQQQGLNFAPNSAITGPTPPTTPTGPTPPTQNSIGQPTEQQANNTNAISDVLEQILEKLTDMPNIIGDTIKEVFSE